MIDERELTDLLAEAADAYDVPADGPYVGGVKSLATFDGSLIAAANYTQSQTGHGSSFGPVVRWNGASWSAVARGGRPYRPGPPHPPAGPPNVSSPT